VRRLDVDGLPPVPPTRREAFAPKSLLELPDGAAPLDDDLTPDAAVVAFGVCHTDSNQHVNSLVYPQLFEEAALRRFAARGRKTAVLARRVEVAFRKPMFAGQTARIRLRAFASGERLGAVGVIEEEGNADGNTYVRMLFEE
jgi:hypothetical protein